MNAARRLLTLSAGFALAALLAGCATGAGSTPAGSQGAPDAEIELDAAWLAGGAVIGLVTQGSSTCVPSVEESALNADGTLSVRLVEAPADTACTRDLVPRVTLVELPEGVDSSQELDIQVRGVGYYGDTELDALAGAPAPEEGAPSAGWTGEDDSFIILTYGSSGCVPVIESVEPTADAEVTVTMQTPPADQVCTADYAPRGTYASVQGLAADDDTPVELVLTGAEFTGERTTILGDR